MVFREKNKTVRAGGRCSYGRHEWDSVSNCHYRKLTPIECERLQTLPDNYTAAVSNTQRYTALGNAFTVEVIAHILRELRQKLKDLESKTRIPYKHVGMLALEARFNRNNKQFIIQ